jgi:O-antigen ligase
MFGIINYGAYVLVFKEGAIKWILYFITLFISTLLGHASLFLAVFMLLLLVLLIKVNLKGKLIALGIALSIVWGLTFLPQFRDANASWRLLFWGEMIDFIIFKNYAIFGEGFGRPYVSMEFAYKIRDQIGGQGFLDKSRYLERWLSPPHNSFITIALHTGLLSLLLLLYPLKGIFKFFFVNGHKSVDKTKLYITILLFSYIVWVSFNVVLELPHSAILFWLVFFIAIEYFIQNKNYNEIYK